MLLLKNHIWKLITDTFHPHQWSIDITDIIEFLNYSVLYISIIVLIIALISLTWSLYRRIKCKNSASKNIYTRRLFQWWAFSTFASGFLIYFIGFNYGGTSTSTFVYVLRPLISAMEMFLSKSDLIAVYDGCKSNPYYMTIFAVTHASAVAVSACFAISCLGKRLRQKLRKLLWRLQSKKGRTLNLFFGLNEQSFLLAKSIFNADNSERIIFIDYPDETKEYAHRLTFGNIFGLFSYKSKQLSKLNDIKYLLFNASFNPVEIEDHSSISASAEFNYILKLNTENDTIRLFFLSDDEDSNVKSMLNILRCDALNAPRIEAYCRARHNCANDTLEIQSGEKAHVKIIDDSQYSIISLKKGISAQNDISKQIAHPINFVDIDTNNSCVTSAFNAMIIGFGTTGQDALRFIYEFSAFPDKDGNKSSVHIDIFDPCMSRQKADFIKEVPGIETLQNEITLHDTGTDSVKFWANLKTSIDSLNYVVIATGDDDRNLTITTQLYEFVNQYRSNGFDQFHIFVRIYKPENELRLEHLKNYYNINNIPDIISIFGYMKDIYTKEQIIDNKLLSLAKDFYENYKDTHDKVLPDEHIDDWDTRHNKWHESTKYDTPMLRWRSLKRQESQDFSNSLHCYTKKQLFGNNAIPEHLPDFPFKSTGSSDDDKKLFNILTNLSICEHLRWNASHLMMGYVEMTEANKAKETVSCNEATKQHKCITDWNNLEEYLQNYDYIVVKTTLKY